MQKVRYIFAALKMSDFQHSPYIFCTCFKGCQTYWFDAILEMKQPLCTLKDDESSLLSLLDEIGADRPSFWADVTSCSLILVLLE